MVAYKLRLIDFFVCVYKFTIERLRLIWINEDNERIVLNENYLIILLNFLLVWLIFFLPIV